MKARRHKPRIEQFERLYLEPILELIPPRLSTLVIAMLRDRERPKKHDGRVKWTAKRHAGLLQCYAGFQMIGWKREQVIDHLATEENTTAKEIEKQITKARGAIHPDALPKWALWVLKPKSKPPIKPPAIPLIPPRSGGVTRR